MDFFQSIPISLHPIKSTEHWFQSFSKRLICRVAVICIIATLIYGVFFTVLEEDTLRAQILSVLLDVPNMVCLFLFAESFVVRNDLKKFVEELVCIDDLMRQQLPISMKYDEEEARARKRFVWLRRFCVVFFVVQFFMCLNLQRKMNGSAQGVRLNLLWMTCRIQLPIVVLHLYFHRLITFVELVKHRYQLINECVYNFHTFTDDDYFERSADVREYLNSDDAFEKLQNIRRVCQLLYSASNAINDLFKWSLLVCIFYSFVCLFVIGYLTLVLGNGLDLFLMFANHFVAHIYSVATLASVCQLTAQEVRMRKLYS